MRNILLVYFSLSFQFVFSQSLDLGDYTIVTYKTHFKKANSAAEFWNEIPPWVIAEGWHQYFFTTHFTTTWRSPSSISQPKNDYIFVGSSQGSTPVNIVSSSHWWGKFYNPDYLGSAHYRYSYEWKNHHWRRNYNGVFSAHLIHHRPLQQDILFAISHGENKNEKIEKYLYQNSVRADFIINGNNPLTYSGGSPYQDCWEAYFGFLNGNWIGYSEQRDGRSYLNDLGPLAWPSAGYLKPNGEQASKGLRHPSSIIHDDYLYIYVIDESMDGKAGVKLIRSHLDELLHPSAYETWSSSGWLSALPEGFKKEEIARFFKTRGPDNTPVFSPDRNTIRFAVAKFRDTENFIGVEEYIMGGNDNTIKVAFRLSDDLVNWSDRVEFYSNDNWASSELRYPIFLNREGTSNTEINSKEFYVLGSAANGTITKYHFNIKLSENKHPESGLFINMGGNSSLDNSLAKVEFTVFPVPAFFTIDIKMDIISSSELSIVLYNANGSKIKTLLNEYVTPQLLIKSFDVSDLQAGLYVVEFVMNDERQYKRIVKL